MTPSIFFLKLSTRLKSWISIGRKNEGVPDPMRTRLPTELYRHIFSFLHPTVKLYPLLFIDFGFHVEAERSIYTNISLEGDRMGQASSYGRSRGEKVGYKHVQRRMTLFKILARTPHLSHLVQSLAVPPLTIYLGEWRKLGDRNMGYSYWRLLNLALRAMPNLKEFEISGLSTQEYYRGDLAIQKLPAILNGCSFRLRTLSLLDYPYYNDLQILENDAWAGQLESLTISWELYNVDLDKAFPQLVVLEVHGEHHTAVRLMDADRNIRALYLVGWSLDPAQGYITRLATDAYPELRSLRVCLPRDWDDLQYWSDSIPRLSVAFPSLSFFRVDYSSFSDHNLARIVREAAPALRALARLKKVVFCSGDVAWDGVVDRYRWTIGGNSKLKLWSREIARRLFTTIPQLEVVRVGFEEWSRINMETVGQTAVDDNPTEWKDKSFWT